MKSTHCFARGSGFRSQHPRQASGSSQPPVTPTSEEPDIAGLCPHLHSQRLIIDACQCSECPRGCSMLCSLHKDASLFSFSFLVYVYVHVCAQTCEYACRRERSMLDVFLSGFITLFFWDRIFHQTCSSCTS